MSDHTDDAILGGRLRLLQPARGHRAGTDAILLAAAVPAHAGDHVLDLGAGVGTAGLALVSRIRDCRLTLVEIEQNLAELARSNAERNGIVADVRLLDAIDLGKSDSSDLANAVDHVLSNPPFHPSSGRASPDPTTARARTASPDLLETWSRAAARILKPGGTFTLIHRPDAIQDILAALVGRFGDLKLRFVHADEMADAVRLLVRGIKGSRAPLTVAPPLILTGEEGLAAHREAAPIEL
ncbi:tRNA1(Val) (adenine(37)-N6)-methyltransferase [Flaviflagellibacter deserti]|uniref:tRNA1(Val) (Adenine(37)-N6)-methyltransferase n=1 Tax=Flaviflagellibacter deserti TaxID=2267266 RepID=A0ABV9YV30_9HYPH